jgi:hypothetical protein
MAEFEGECIGAHKFHTVLKLGNEKIDVIPLDHYPEEFALSILYKSITEVQVLTSAQVSSFLAIGNNAEMLALTAGVSILSNIVFNKPKMFLVISFKDEFGPLNVAFKMKKTEEAQNAINDKITQATKNAYGGKLKLCPQGHENSPSAKECWICGTPINNQKTA